MTQYVKRGSVAYELGANYGMHTLLLAKLVGPAGRVYAFEPDPEIFSALNEQLTLNDLHNVDTMSVAVADQVGTACFDRAHHRGAGHLVSANKVISTTSFQVRTTTLDKFVLLDGNAPPGFVKIDIEGAESAALQGCIGVIEQHQPILMIELHNPTEDRAVGTLLKIFGYTAFRVQSGQPVENMEIGWPDTNGMWGTVVAFPRCTDPH
jgi:FkbM family methyltransferase